MSPGFVLAHERSDRLTWLGKARVVLVDDDLGDKGNDLLFHLLFAQFILERLSYLHADCTLGIGDAVG